MSSKLFNALKNVNIKLRGGQTWIKTEQMELFDSDWFEYTVLFGLVWVSMLSFNDCKTAEEFSLTDRKSAKSG